MSRKNNAASRRTVLKLPLALLGAAVLSHPLAALARPGAEQITVWKTPDCGCCKEWVAHLRANGFEVITHDVQDTAPVRQRLGLPARFGSCHTAQTGAYVLEGHVPAQEVKRMLREKPKALGLAVPGMPMGSPGMEMSGPMAGARDAFDVLLVSADGNARIYQSYPSRSPVKPSKTV
jgi:hypothetical protein